MKRDLVRTCVERSSLQRLGGLSSYLRARFTRTDAGLFIAIVVVMSLGVGSYGLYEPHEAQYGGGAQEMLLRKDLITPYLDGWPELNKPPLFYWIIASGYAAFSHIASPEFCARFPQVLVAVFGSLIAWLWAFDLWGRRSARLAAVMLSVSAGWWLFAHQLLIDELLGTLFLASLYFYGKPWSATICPNGSCFYVSIALATLAKGLLGIAFPVGVLVLYILVLKKWSLIRKSRPLMGCLIFAAIVGPWVYLFERDNPGAIKYMIVNEHFNRLFDMRVPHDYEVVQTDAVTFVLITLVWLMPWVLFMPEIIGFVWTELKSRHSAKPAITKDSELDAPGKFDGILILCIAALLVVGFFTVIPSRLVYYALPAIPPFMVLCAGAFENRISNPIRSGKLDCLAPVLFGVVLVALVPVIPSWLKLSPELQLVIGSNIGVSLLASAVGLSLCAAGMLMKRGNVTLAVIVMTGLMCTSEIYAVSYFRMLDPVYSSKALVREFEPILNSDIIWVTEASEEVGAAGGISYYLRQRGLPEQVYILESRRRPPPCYPGARPTFLLDNAQFEEIWESDRPVLFVTDFQRTDWDTDPPALPINCQFLRVSNTGHRQVFANRAASKLKEASRYIPIPAEIPQIEVSKISGN